MKFLISYAVKVIEIIFNNLIINEKLIIHENDLM